MGCPKDSIIATFLYLEEMAQLKDSDQKIDISSEDVEKITTTILEKFSEHENEKTKEAKAKKDLPHDLKGFTFSSKEATANINYIEYGGVVEDRDSNSGFTVSSKYDVGLSVDCVELTDSVVAGEVREHEANKIVLDNEYNVGYSFNTDERGLGHDISKSIVDYLSNEREEDGFYMRDFAEFSEYLVRYFSSKTQTDIVQNLGDSLTISKFDFSPDKVESFQQMIVESNLLPAERLNNMSDSIIESIREEMNLSFKSDIISMIEERGLGYNKVKSFLELKGFNENRDFLSKLTSSKDFNIKININTRDFLNPIFKLKKKKEDFLIYAKNKAEETYLNDDLIKKEKRFVLPKKTIIDLSKTAPKVELDYSENDEEIKLVRAGNKQSSKTTFYSKNYIEMKKGSIMAIDESDSGAKGDKAKVARMLAKASQHVITATGTATDGYVGNFAYQLDYGMDADSDVEEFSKQLTQDYGVFSIKEPSIRLLLGSALKDDEVEELFNEAVKKYNKINESKGSGSNNLHTVVADFTKDFIKMVSSKKFLNEELDYTKALSSFSFLLEKASKETKDKDGVGLLKSVLFSDRMGSRTLVKLEVGIQSIGGFVRLLNSQGGNISIATRALLHNIEEKDDFPDLTTHYRNKDKIVKGECDIEEVKNTNNLSALLTSESLNFYSSDRQISSFFHVLTKNFGKFTESFKKDKSNLQLVLPEGMERKEFLSVISKSGDSTKDSVEDLYRNYLKNNGELVGVEDERKVKALEHLVGKFQKYFIEGQIKKTLSDEENNFNFLSVDFPSTLSNSSGDISLSDDIDYSNAYPYNSKLDEEFIFSVNTKFTKKAWEEFSEPLDFKYNLTDRTQKEVVEMFASKGREDNIRKQVLSGNSSVNGSSRTLVTVFNVFDCIASAKDREDKSKPLLVLVVESSGTREHMAAVKEEYLKDNNISLQVIPSSLISSEVDKACAQGLQVQFFTNISAGARGLDLSSLGKLVDNKDGGKERYGEIIATGLKVSSDDIQFLSRMNKPPLCNNKSVLAFSGGENVSIAVPPRSQNDKIEPSMQEIRRLIEDTRVGGSVVFKDTENERLEGEATKLILEKVISLAPTFVESMASRGLDALKISKGFNSGTISDTSVTNKKDIVEPTKSYLEMINKRRVGTEVSVENYMVRS